MQFFKITEDNIKEKKILSQGIEVDLMVKAMTKIAKDYPFVDSVIGFGLIFVDSKIKVDEKNVVNQYKISSKLNLLVAKNNEKLELLCDNKSYYIYPRNDALILSDKLITLEELDNTDKSKKNFNEQEKLAIKWLESGRTGVSSKTMCFNIFPKVKEYYMKNISQDNYDSVPYDTSDFGRCIGFIKSAEVTLVQIAKMSEISNSKWGMLVNNWEEITQLIESGNAEKLNQANELIRQYIKPVSGFKVK